MHRRTSKYSISKYIYSCLKDSGLKPSELVAMLGYKNITKGIRVLDKWLQEGCGSRYFLENLVAGKFADQVRLEEALKETHNQKVKEQKDFEIAEKKRRKDNFRPYIFVETSLDRPTSITFAALMNFRMRFIDLPDEFVSMPEDLAIPKVKNVVWKHFRESSGKCLFFGEIEGYVFVWKWEKHFSLSKEGEVTKEMNQEFVVPFAGAVSI